MSIATTDNKATYQGNGVTTSWPFTFPVLEEGHLSVILTDPDGLETTLTGDYVVDLTNKVVTYPGYLAGQEPPVESQPPVLPSGSHITLLRVVPYTQDTDLGDRWPFNVIEAVLDRTTMQLQQLAEASARSVKTTVSSTITPDQLLTEIRTGAVTATAKAAEATGAASTAIAKAAEADADSTAAAASADTATTKAAEALSSAGAAEAKAAEASADAATASVAATTATTKAAEASASAAAALASENNAKTSETNVTALVSGATVQVPVFPVGVPFPWASTEGYPSGTLVCNGQSFDKLAYPELAKVYPSGVLPDLRGVALRGLDGGSGRDADGASRVRGSYQADELKSHSHTINAQSGLSSGSGFMAQSGVYQSTFMTNATGGTETRMKNVGVDWLVYVSTIAYDLSMNNANAAYLGGYAPSQFVRTDTIKAQLNAAGDAPIGACRARVNFNGQGTVAIRGNMNVSSVTDNGVGDYTINFAAPMPDANYSMIGGAIVANGGTPCTVSVYVDASNVPILKTTSSVRIRCVSGSGSLYDSSDYALAIFR